MSTTGKTKYRYPKSSLLKLFGATLCAITFSVCLYAGITGKINVLQEYIKFGKGGSLKSTYRWAADGLLTSIGFTLFLHYALNDMNLWMSRNKHSCILFLISILPGICLLLFGVYKDLGIAGIKLWVILGILLFVSANFIDLMKKRKRLKNTC